MSPFARSGARTLAEPAVLRACCAELWTHPGVRVLVGDALHPGGAELTARALDQLALPPGARLLDVGSGPGATRDLAAERDLCPVGVDLSPAWGDERRPGWFSAGDAERLPFRDATFDGAITECTLSVVADKAAALAEIRRVVRPGGRVAVSDVTAREPLPPELETVLGWIACAAGALPIFEYAAALERSGFRPAVVEAHGPALAEMLAKARRRLALLAGAVTAGLVNPEEANVPTGLLRLGDRLLGLAADAVADGILGYCLIVAG